MSCRSVSDWRGEGCRFGRVAPLSVVTVACAAAITLSSGETDGFVMYLCLKNAAPEIRVACVDADQNLQHQ